MRIQMAFQVALAGVLLLPSSAATARTNDADTVEPQIVRLNLVEGDVRIARDKQQGQAKNADWEKAITGLPLESGFTIATDTGRAVIELQDASTIYMAPNSVLVLNDLTAVGNTPHTEVALLSGTVTLHVHPAFAGEQFILRAPTDTMSVNYPDHTDFRVTAYMDALALTPLEKAVLPGKPASETPATGQTLYFRAGKQVKASDKSDEAAMASWDKWVADKFSERVAAYNSVAQEAGIKTFVPGLDSLQGKGRFVDCGQYGKCWEPPQPPAPQQLAAAQAGANPQASGSAGNSGIATALAANTAQAASSVQSDTSSSGTSSTQPVIIRKTSVAPRPAGSGLAMAGGMGFDPFFPCGPGSFYYGDMMMYSYGGMYGGMMMSPYGGMYGGMYNGMMAGYGGMYDPYLWNWAVCHTGSWIYQNNQYLWVPGGGSQIHYQPPVQWVKWGGKQGYVPIHPRDIAGQTPVNLQHGMIAVNGRNSLETSQVSINGGGSVKLLNSPPRAFRQGYSISLARADSPRIEGRLLGTAAGQKGLQAGNPRTVSITFDHNSRSFMVARQVGEGRSIKTVNEPVGSFLVRSGVGGFGGPRGGYQSVAEPGGRGDMGAFNGGNRGAFNGGDNGGFRGGSVFNGGAQRGNGGFGGNNGGFNGGPAMGGAPGRGSMGGGSMGGGSMGGGSMGGGSMGGGSMGGGSMGGGSMGGGAMGGGHAGGGSAPASTPGR